MGNTQLVRISQVTAWLIGKLLLKKSTLILISVEGPFVFQNAKFQRCRNCRATQDSRNRNAAKGQSMAPLGQSAKQLKLSRAISDLIQITFI